MIIKNNLHISDGNKKTGDIPAFNLLPGITCSAAAKITCYINGCYAVNDLRYPTTRNAWTDNTNAVMNDLPGVKAALMEFFGGMNAPRFFRIHSSGDFITRDYALMWYEVAKANPHTNFLAFTKQFDNVRGVPFYELDNFSLVLSSWNGHDVPADLMELYTVAYCDDGVITIPEYRPLIECPGNCDRCGVCWSLSKRGLNVKFKKHGAKKNKTNE